jgi:FKBP-type peptidyl-prolyl cis-trans isomerase FkpA
MSMSARRFRPLALSLLAAPLLAAAPAPAPRAANGGIIALPLVPIVPPVQRNCATRLPNGLGLTVLREGAGAKPVAADTVLVDYIGYLAASGAVFDQGQQSVFGVGDVIPGFGQGLQQMTRNSVVRLCIPAALGYAARATGTIPANSDLVFQVTLLDFKTPAEIEALRAGAAAQTPETTPQGTAPQP